MKKAKRAAFTPGASLSIEDMEQEGVKDVFAQQAHQQKPEIKLNLGNGKEATFELIIIQPDEVKRKTTVFSGNDRIQEALNPLTLRDILPSIRRHGMTFPAIGRTLPDGRIEVLEGSRRRESCILTGQLYYIYVTSSELVDYNTARYLSTIGNAYKQLSQYEQGKRYMELIDAGYSQAEVARQEGISRMKVGQARDAFLLPEAFYHAHASGFELGRPRINAYRAIWKQAEEYDVAQELLEFISEIKPNELAAAIDTTELNLKRAIKLAKEGMTKQDGNIDDYFATALACQNVAELMQHTDIVEDLGLAETIMRLVDRAASREINEAFESLMPEPQDTHESHQVFAGRDSLVTSKPINGGTQLTFRKVPTEQLQEIEKLIADFLRQQEEIEQVE